MALSAVALLPHSPLLIPEIGRANYDFLAKTAAAYATIGDELAAKAVDTVVVISPHGPKTGTDYILNVAPEMIPDFRDFGFLPTPEPVNGDAILADQIKNALRPDFPLILSSETNLDYGSGVPLYILKKRLPGLKALILHPAESQSPEEQAAFGARLGGVIAQRNKNIAVIASGDLSHRLKKKSPGGYSPKGAKFDNRIIEILSDGPAGMDDLLSLDKNLAADAGQCGLRSLAVALGTLGGIDWRPEILAYQTDFGIGYLSVAFHFPKAGEETANNIQ